MPFPEAFRLCLDGAAIARSCWRGSIRIKMVDGELVELMRDPNLESMPVLLCAQDLQALDWETIRGG